MTDTGTSLLSQLAALHRNVNDLGLEMIGQDRPAEEVAVAREVLVAIGEDLATIRGDLSQVLLDALGDGEALDTPVGQFKKEPDTKRSAWDPDLLLLAVERVLVRHAKVKDTSAKQIARWVHLHAPFRPDWKVTKLRELGIAPAEYCREEFGRKVTHQGTKEAVRRLLASLGGAPLSTQGPQSGDNGEGDDG